MKNEFFPLPHSAFILQHSSIAARRHKLLAIAHLDDTAIGLGGIDADRRDDRLRGYRQEFWRHRRAKARWRRTRLGFFNQRPGEPERDQAALLTPPAIGTARGARLATSANAIGLAEASRAAAHHLVRQRTAVDAAGDGSQAAAVAAIFFPALLRARSAPDHRHDRDC